VQPATVRPLRAARPVRRIAAEHESSVPATSKAGRLSRPDRPGPGGGGQQHDHPLVEDLLPVGGSR
jgi:hypothetical protein